ncbi:RHS repeat domain-containing protein [Streptomyces albus]|uniref:RHS repeat domain-containing protein n=1 Tax=Streptomyces albus TaxID=1888 RepID=UPI003700139B
MAVDCESEELTRRRTLPFGAERAEKPKDWPTSRGFVGGVDETRTTGLTHLGAREYDPDTGRFISVDPLMDPGNPQQLHGYSYGNNSTLVYSDPDGLMPIWGAIGSAVGHATRHSAGRHRPVCDTGCQARKQYRGGSIPITGYEPSADRAVAPKLAEAASRRAGSDFTDAERKKGLRRQRRKERWRVQVRLLWAEGRAAGLARCQWQPRSGKV